MIDKPQEVEELAKDILSRGYYYGDQEMDDERILQEAMQGITTFLTANNKEAFQRGQEDCRKAGNPKNHVHYEEAVAASNREAEIKAIEDFRKNVDSFEYEYDGGEKYLAKLKKLRGI